jgi:hypothetical protein
MNWFQVLYIAGTIAQTYGNLYAAYAQKAAYDAQADWSLREYKSKKLDAKADGVQVLKRLNSDLATIVANGAAGNVMTTSGSIYMQKIMSVRRGSEDFGLAGINQTLMENIGALQFANLKQAGKYAKKLGVINAIADLGMSFANYKMLGLNKYQTTTEISPITKIQGHYQYGHT